MIGFIRGTILVCWNNFCLVLTSGGTGYQLALPDYLFNALPPPGEEVEFFTSLAVREDALELFGFATLEERQMFEILTHISKIGPRTALAILSMYRPDELKNIALEANEIKLMKVSGIGKKNAQHILLELKYKLGKNVIPTREQKITGSSTFNDVMEAMANLGYDESECGKEIKRIIDAEPDIDVGSAIRLTLKALAKK